MTIKRTAGAALLASAVAWMPVSSRADEPLGREAAAADVAPGPECDGAAVAVVAQVLRLAPEQVHAFGQLLETRQAVTVPILHEIALREEHIRALVAGGGNPAAIGVLVIQVHQLRQAAAAAQAQFLAAFAGLLNDDQRGAWEQVRVAARLQPVLPAFQTLQAL